jgi:gliding motility-associated-like protein
MKSLKLVILLFLLINQLFAQQVTTFAGNGVSGFANGLGVNAKFDSPYTLDIDTLGNLFVCDILNNRIRKIDTLGNVTTYAGSGVKSHLDGPSNTAEFNWPWGVWVVKNDVLIIGDNLNERLRKIENGIVTTIAGSGVTGNLSGPAMSSQFNKPYGICMDTSGTIFFVDRYNNQVKKLTTAGDVILVAGSGNQGFVNGQGAAASFSVPSDITIDIYGNLFVTDRDNHAIRKITPNGLVTTFAGGSVGMLNANGTQARFNNPHGIFIDKCNNLYVADMFNHMIRKIDASGNVTTVAGSGSPGFINGPASLSHFNHPFDVVKDKYGNLFVTDCYNHSIRKITFNAGNRYDTTVCIGSNIKLEIPPADSISWVPSAGLSCSNCPDPSHLATVNTQYIAYSYKDCEIRIDTFNIIVPDTAALIGSRQTLTFCDGIMGEMLISEADSISWQPNTGLTCNDCFNPQFIANRNIQYISHSYRNCRILKDTFDIITKDCTTDTIDGSDKILIPNVISPNDDGENDFFVIKNLPPNTFVRIYNRWGNKIFESENYTNNWGGRNLKGNEVVDGTYFYIIKFDRKEDLIHGTLTILR